MKEVGAASKGFGAFYHAPGELMERLHKYVLTYFRDSGDEYIMLAVFGIMLVGLMLRGSSRTVSSEPALAPDGLRARERILPELLTLLLAASVFLLPVHIKGQAVISVRHIPLTVISAIAWLGWPRRRWASIGAGLLIAALVVTQSVYVARHFKDYERELDGYEQLFDDLPAWSRLYKLSGRDLFSRVAHGNVFWHLHYLHLVWNGGITDVNFAEHVTCPIQYRLGMIPPRLPLEPERSKNWRYYDYFPRPEAGRQARRRAERLAQAHRREPGLDDVREARPPLRGVVGTRRSRPEGAGYRARPPRPRARAPEDDRPAETDGAREREARPVEACPSGLTTRRCGRFSPGRRAASPTPPTRAARRGAPPASAAGTRIHRGRNCTSTWWRPAGTGTAPTR